MLRRYCLATFLCLLPAHLLAAVEVELSGNVELEVRSFFNDSIDTQPPIPGADDQVANLSVNFDPKLEVFIGDDHTFIFEPFFRWDLHDGRRTHFDIRELKWVGVFGDLEVRIGADKVFWGVTESAHLVDVINQDDAVEDIDGEDKLGQPLVSLSYQTSIGTFTAFIMPYFRDRTFAGLDGRPRAPLPVAVDLATYGAGDNQWHVDVALRWFHYIGPVDLSLSHFRGFSRDPDLRLTLDENQRPVLAPHYPLINQTGATLQATLGSWLLKFEGITTKAKQDHTQLVDTGRWYAFAVGFEYTFFSAFDGPSDIGLLAEFLYDSRGKFGPSPSEEDIFIGARWTANDVQSTQLLAGMVFDLDTSSKLAFIEFSRRLGDVWRITLDARIFISTAANDPLYFFRKDSFVQLRLARFI